MKWGIISPNSPHWFKQMQLRFRWYADSNWGQCGDNSGRGEVCASVGSFTPFYRDNTDRRPGGCQMSWMLKVPSPAPSLMLTSKLCYKWYADGDGGQCGHHSNEYCAVTNQWTAYYRDDTDRQPGGGQMVV